MSILATVTISVINIYNSIRIRHKKIPVILFIILLGLLMGANTKNPDFNAYLFAYNPNRVGSDFGYSLLVKLFNLIGFSYSSFRITISFIGIFLISKTVNKFVKNKSAFYILYFIYPFIVDIVQIRNFLVMSILIFLSPYLLTDKRLDKVKYILGISIAATIQLTAIFYIPLVFITKIRKNILYKIIIIMSTLMIILISVNKPLLNEFSRFVIMQFGDIDERISVYSKIQTNYGFLLLWILQSISYFLIIWANRIFKRNNQLLNTEESNSHNIVDQEAEIEYKFLTLIKWINILAFFFFPFYVFQITFSRLMRNIMPLNIIAFLIAEQTLRKNRKRNYFFRLAFVCFHLILIWIDLRFLYPNINIYEIITNNWIL
ncbi:EpsG family protein [Jeotgalibaca porci]|uniref:EpsG family protein n=1 Tax=Jeotgalibaca porci TaxID=1868793 RepID=UPI003F92FF32